MQLTPYVFAAMLVMSEWSLHSAPKSAAQQDKTISAETRLTSVKFEGRAVTVTIPKTDKGGFFPEGPSTVCIEGPHQCYTAPRDYGIDPRVEIVELTKGK